MDRPSPSIAIDVDVTNPGEFFACCGLLEMADRLCGGADGWFDEQSRFCIAPWKSDSEVSLKDVLWALAGADVEQAAGGKTASLTLTRPVQMKLDWWERPGGKQSGLKLWAGHQTSRQLMEKLLVGMKDVLGEESPHLDSELFRAAARGSGGLGFDAAIGWNNVDAGFSYNNPRAEAGRKGEIRPSIEILAAIGLQRFRPVMSGRVIRYAVWSSPLPPAAARMVVATWGLDNVEDVLEARVRSRGSYRYLEFARSTGVDGGR